jgi:hypothetical protein
MTMYQGTRIEGTPTFAGVGGSAWRLELPAVGQRRTRDEDGTVGGFILHVPGAHVLWDHYAISVVHLRPIEGVRAPTKRFETATHEFLIMSLNPEQPLPSSLRVDDEFRLNYLTPIDVVEQFEVPDDVGADHILEMAVRAIVDGFASPDQDWRLWWAGAIKATAAHYRDGTHRVEMH